MKKQILAAAAGLCLLLSAGAIPVEAAAMDYPADTEETDASTGAVSRNDSAGSEKTDASTGAEIPESTAGPSEADCPAEWIDRLISAADSDMTIYTAADPSSEAVGSLNAGCYAEVQDYSGDWYLVTAGSLSGYIQADQCLTGQAAYEYAVNTFGRKATVLENHLRLRESPSLDSTILAKLSKGTVLTLNTDVEETADWIPVFYGDQAGYVSADYVSVELNVSEGGIPAGAIIDYTEEDRTLLAAIIDCEAGGSTYEGMVAVGSVIMNRIESSEFPDNLRDVIYQKHQFSPASSGFLKRKLKSGNINPEAFDAADAVLHGERTTDCLYFWEASSGRFGTIIGDNVFFNY